MKPYYDCERSHTAADDENYAGCCCRDCDCRSWRGVGAFVAVAILAVAIACVTR